MQRAKNFVVIYSGRTGSSPIINILARQPGLCVPVFENLDHRFVGAERAGRIPEILDEVFRTGALAGAPPRLPSLAISEDAYEYAPVAGLRDLRAARTGLPRGRVRPHALRAAAVPGRYVVLLRRLRRVWLRVRCDHDVRAELRSDGGILPGRQLAEPRMVLERHRVRRPVRAELQRRRLRRRLHDAGRL